MIKSIVSMKLKISALITALTAMTTACSVPGAEEYLTDSIGINVNASEDREYSYTDKKAGYWYGNTHSVAPQWYSGWNMAKKRILSDYTISVDGEALDRSVF